MEPDLKGFLGLLNEQEVAAWRGEGEVKLMMETFQVFAGQVASFGGQT